MSIAAPLRALLYQYYSYSTFFDVTQNASWSVSCPYILYHLHSPIKQYRKYEVLFARNPRNLLPPYAYQCRMHWRKSPCRTKVHRQPRRHCLRRPQSGTEFASTPERTVPNIADDDPLIQLTCNNGYWEQAKNCRNANTSNARCVIPVGNAQCICANT